jgi:hypothetical protein
MSADSQQECFVIMPFSATVRHTQDFWDKHYKDFLRPAIEQTGLFSVHRSKPLCGDLLKQIIHDLVVCPLVIADLTDSNANVYWELGVRQSFSNGTITIAEKGTDLPFDLSRKGTHFYYPKGDNRNSNFLADFQEAVKKVYANQHGQDSDVLQEVSGRGTLFAIVHKEETIRRIEGLIEEVLENKNFLNTMAEALNRQIKVPLGYYFFQYSSLELLLTQRYLEGEQEVYSDARSLFLFITATNSAFSQYKDDWEKLIKFFSNTSALQKFNNKLVSFNAKLHSVLEKLEAIR